MLEVPYLSFLVPVKNESQAVEYKIVDLLAAMTGDCADAVVVPLTVIISWISAVGDLGRWIYKDSAVHGY